MNKKQLIVAWIMGALVSAVLLGLSRKPHLYLLYGEYSRRIPVVWSLVAATLIIGILLIYTIRDKKK